MEGLHNSWWPYSLSKQRREKNKVTMYLKMHELKELGTESLTKPFSSYSEVKLAVSEVFSKAGYYLCSDVHLVNIPPSAAQQPHWHQTLANQHVQDSGSSVQNHVLPATRICQPEACHISDVWLYMVFLTRYLCSKKTPKFYVFTVISMLVITSTKQLPGSWSTGLTFQNNESQRQTNKSLNAILSDARGGSWKTLPRPWTCLSGLY